MVTTTLKPSARAACRAAVLVTLLVSTLSFPRTRTHTTSPRSTSPWNNTLVLRKLSMLEASAADVPTRGGGLRAPRVVEVAALSAAAGLHRRSVVEEQEELSWILIFDACFIMITITAAAGGRRDERRRCL
ncbi:unnamed protein product [Laminaria digitata]